MDIQITKEILELDDIKVEAFLFLPKSSQEPFKHGAIFTHGYTSHKSVLVPWASKIVDRNIPTLIFDLPGHFLGSFNEAPSFDSFKVNAPKLFEVARNLINKRSNQEIPFYFIGGHSLGALVSLLSLKDLRLESNQKLAIGVGFGAPPENITHIFDTPFFKKTMEIRKQLVSKSLDPKTILPWIRDTKNSNMIKNQRIHLISGQDDVIVGKNGLDRLIDHLESSGNKVSFDKPKNLPHHLPENGSTHISHFIKKFIEENS